MLKKDKLNKKKGRVGIEPTTCRSAVGCSTTELTALFYQLNFTTVLSTEAERHQ